MSPCGGLSVKKRLIGRQHLLVVVVAAVETEIVIVGPRMDRFVVKYKTGNIAAAVAELDSVAADRAYGLV